MGFSSFSCRDIGSEAISFDPITESPYNDPIWHPVAKIIGFNHMPIKEVYQENGRQVFWKSTLDSMGFWLINSDGTNKRRILPYYLYNPMWSADGKWIAFSKGAQICVMPFDGEQFDTTAIQVLTNKGRNFSPKWNSDGTKIAFVESICDETLPCGIWTYSLETKKREFIIKGTSPDWVPHTNLLTFLENISDNGVVLGDNIKIVDVKDISILTLTKLVSPNIDNRYLQCSPNGNYIGFISILENGEGIQLYRINSDGTELTKLTSDYCTQFSWSPDGRIVYVQFNYRSIGKTNGTLWTMNGDGSNKQPLTFNKFELLNVFSK